MLEALYILVKMNLLNIELPVHLMKSLCSGLSNPLDAFRFTQSGLILFALNNKLKL
jgi:hypothetical protein